MRILVRYKTPMNLPTVRQDFIDGGQLWHIYSERYVGNQRLKIILSKSFSWL
jgi:hypothetical protein